MVKDAIATGATIEEAQQSAIRSLNAPDDADVQFEVLQFPEKKKFGLFGGKQAEVRAFYEAKEEKPKKVATVKKSSGAKAKAQQKAEKPANQKKEKAAAPKKTAEEKKGTSPKKAEKAAEKPAEPREAVSMEEAPEQVKKAYAYLKTVIEGLGIENYDIDVTKAGKEYFFEVSSEDNYSLLIGRRGETLDSIQYLTRLAANRGKEDGKSVRISINVGDYREKRERTLKDIARKNGRRVRKYGRNMTLNPMNPSERRIIHTTIAEMEGLQSYSIGSDADRRVVIALAEGVEPLQPRNNGGRGRNDRGRGGRGNDRGGRGRNDRGGRGNGGNRGRSAASDAPAAPARAPRSDSEGTRYGIIAPKFDAEEIKAKAKAEQAAAAEAEAENAVAEVAAPAVDAATDVAPAAEAQAPAAPVLSDAEPENFEVLYDAPAAPTEE
ncbi:MAG: RNA-binding cell elongation regulator Jag/EloR [Eubacteriales bacterium]|nr:RNA-binding cell elongation regulator Jag/EloR [Eubacteriales bacterium]